MYYDLLPFPRVVTQVVKEFQRVSNPIENRSVDEQTDSLVQLGLCHIISFGVEKSNLKAIELFIEAARKGSYKSRAILPSLFTAFNIHANEELQSEFIDWQIQASSIGSKTASRYLSSWNGVNGTFHRNLNDSLQSQNEPELLSAVACGNIEQVTSLLEYGVSPMIQGRQGDTPLHRSVLLPVDLGIPIATALLSHGANPFDLRRRPWRPVFLSKHDFLFNEMPQGTSAMDWAVMENNLPMVKLMLQCSKDPNVVNNLLHIACQYLSVECLQYLLEQLATHSRAHNAVNRFKSGYSLLYYAIRPDIFNRLLGGINVNAINGHSNFITSNQRQLEVTKILQKIDQNIDMTPEKSFSAIHLLAAYGEPEILEGVLQSRTFRKLIDESNSKAYGDVSPLREAIIRGRVDAFRVLLRHGADFRSVCNGNHAIHACAQLRERAVCDIAETLISRDPSCLFIKSRNFHIYERRRDSGYEIQQAQRAKFDDKLLVNATALHWAAYYNNTDLLKFCLSKGHDLLRLDTFGYTPLGLAVASRSVRTVRLLRHEHIRKGVPLQALNLHYRFWHSKSAVAFVMISAGFWTPMEPCDEYSPTPFSRSSQLIVKILMRDYRPTIRFGSNSIYRIFAHPCDEAGVYHAISAGDSQSTKEILECKSIQAPVYVLRDLIQYSVYLLKLAESGAYRHRIRCGSDNMWATFGYLLQKYKDEYDRLKSQRESSWAGSFWRLYYETYGDFEENQYRQLRTWQINQGNKLVQYSLREFEKTTYIHFVPRLLFSWSFLIPLLYSYSRTNFHSYYLGPSVLLVSSALRSISHMLTYRWLSFRLLTFGRLSPLFLSRFRLLASFAYQKHSHFLGLPVLAFIVFSAVHSLFSCCVD